MIAHLRLSLQVLRTGEEDPNEQWVTFAPEHVPLVLAEHPTWKGAWDTAWDAYLLTMQRIEQQESQDRRVHLINWKSLQALILHHTPCTHRQKDHPPKRTGNKEDA